MIRHFLGLTLSTAALALAAGTPALASVPANCNDLTPLEEKGTVERRPVTPEDLLRLRDVGLPSSAAIVTPGAIAVSPDQKSVAFQIRRVDKAGTDYCQGLFVASLGAGHQLRQIDSGGKFIRRTLDRTGITGFPTGVAQLITPHWSPDGKWVAYLKRVGDVTQVWRAAADGTHAEQVTSEIDDVEDLRWLRDGLIFITRPALRKARALIEEEGRSGYHYEGRFVPKARSRPFPPIGAEPRYLVNPNSGAAARDATPGEIAAFNERGAGQKPEDAALFASGPAQSRTWTSPRSGSGFLPQYELKAELQSGAKVTCNFDVCDKIVDLWWPAGSNAVLFLRREGWGSSKLALYRWMPGSDEPPERLFATKDMLASCQAVNGKMLCLHEGAESPASLKFVGMDGSLATVVDLNPQLRQLALGKAERLQWRNVYGIETFGDLVLPPDYDGKARLPLIIVQYDSRGFLRGGTGDEYPIQALAGRGFAVLSFERPRFVGMGRPAKDGDELFRHNLEGWADLRSVLSSIETIVDQLASRGVIDPKRVGISGLSDGTRNTQYALANSNRFAAASVSSSFEEPGTFLPLAGPAGARSYIASGYPTMDSGDDFWNCYSLVRNAPRLKVPILMQMSDDEYLGALEPLAAFQAHGVPSALYVFPAEHHIKWQPDHRLAVYYRNIAWFEHWLQPDHASSLASKWLDPALVANMPPSPDSRAAPAPDQCRTQASASAIASKRK